MNSFRPLLNLRIGRFVCWWCLVPIKRWRCLHGSYIYCLSCSSSGIPGSHPTRCKSLPRESKCSTASTLCWHPANIDRKIGNFNQSLNQTLNCMHRINAMDESNQWSQRWNKNGRYLVTRTHQDTALDNSDPSLNSASGQFGPWAIRPRQRDPATRPRQNVSRHKSYVRTSRSKHDTFNSLWF